jgi:signal transduction histidine kinase/CheY-like chemotaxis protein
MTLYETERYNFNINYNPDLRQINLWVNAPVFAEGKPIGMVGTGIDITGFINSMYRDLDTGVELYLFNAFNEITVARDQSLVLDKKDIIDHLGSAGESIVEEAQWVHSSEDIRIITFDDVIYAVSSVPIMNWYIVAFMPAAAEVTYDSVLTNFFMILLALVLVIFIVSNVFAAFIQNTVNAQNRRLLELATEAREANRAKSSFLATMSHEIRTPMNAILGLSEMTIALDNLPAEVYGNIEKIRGAGSSLLSIINDILDLSKIESGKLEITPAAYDLPSIISDVIQINIVRIGDKNIRFVLDVSPDLPATALGDELRIKQILNNILSNAFKYTQHGYVTMSVSHRSDVGENAGENTMILVFRITDTGQGMKDEDVKNLFDEYSRFNAAANRATEGAGLGMSITQKLIAIMNGKIEVESTYGKGSVFTVSIPQGKINDCVIGGELVNNLKNFNFFSDSSAQKREDTIREYMPYGSVLVVDDLDTNLYVAQGLMSPYGLKIETAVSGQEALEKIRTGSVYDIIFMDHMMPVMDGIETTVKIRESGYTGTIIALTANAVSGQKEKFIQSGFNDFISKPIDTRKLDASLNKWIKDKHSPEEAARAVNAGEKNAPPPGGDLPTETGTFIIPGVDVKKGISMTGNTLPSYRKVLSMFRKDAAERLTLLRSFSAAAQSNPPAGKDMSQFIIWVHALKSASATIGAEEVSAEAARLEAAGNAGDMAVIRKHLPGFTEHLAELVEGINALEGSGTEAVQTTQTPVDLTAALPLFTELAEALKGKKMGAIDRILEELARLAPDLKTRETLDAISDHVLMSEFDKALETINTLLEATDSGVML